MRSLVEAALERRRQEDLCADPFKELRRPGFALRRCVICGKPFEWCKKSRRRSGGPVCSPECHAERTSEFWKGRDRPYRRRDISGTRSGRLIALHDAGRSQKGERIWLCRCDCGGTVHASTARITARKVLSCGCLIGIVHAYIRRAVT